MELQKFCDFFYSSHYIPIAVYNNTELEASYSSLGISINFQTALRTHIFSSKRNPEIFSLPELGQYGLIRINGSNESILVGPVFSVPVSESMILSVAHQNFIETKSINELSEFLTSIPNYSYNQFLNLIAYLHYCLNDEVFDVMDYFHTSSHTYEQNVAAAQVDRSYREEEQQLSHGTYQFENMLLSYIRDGETEKLKQFLLEVAKNVEMREGVLADSPLRQSKNLLIGLITMVGKIGAIGGGMDVEETYRLIDLYIQECEKAQSVDAVKMLQYSMVLDFTERVSQCKVPKNTSKEIFLCMQYIQNHTCDSIGINEIAEYAGKSRSYITKHFREETGMSINDFITQCKIRDAKRLLRYSERTLSEISNYLCFSSQAYFQTVFKNETGITPNDYRRKNSFSDSV